MDPREWAKGMEKVFPTESTKDCTQQTHITKETMMQLMDNHAKYKEDFRTALDRSYAN